MTALAKKWFIGWLPVGTPLYSDLGFKIYPVKKLNAPLGIELMKECDE